jgi:hypothetical protein
MRMASCHLRSDLPELPGLRFRQARKRAFRGVHDEKPGSPGKAALALAPGGRQAPFFMTALTGKYRSAKTICSDQGCALDPPENKKKETIIEARRN